MTQAVLNTQLYQKMFAEQERFKEELMQLRRERFCRKHTNMSAGRIFCYHWNTMTYHQAGKGPSEISHAAGGCVQKVG